MQFTTKISLLLPLICKELCYKFPICVMFFTGVFIFKLYTCSLYVKQAVLLVSTLPPPPIAR